MNDLKKAQKVLAERPMTLAAMYRKTDISYPMLKTYAKNPNRLNTAKWISVHKLANLTSEFKSEMTDLDKAKWMIIKKPMQLTDISRETKIAYATLRSYVVNPDKMQNVPWEKIDKLAKLYDSFKQELLNNENLEEENEIQEDPKINIEYNGKTYYRLSDLAKDYGIKPRKLNRRWHSGHRDPKNLVDPHLDTRYNGAHSIIYKGVFYKSASEFSQAFNLNYPKVIALMKQGITNPEVLRIQGKTGEHGVEVVKRYIELESRKKEALINSKGLFTAIQVSKLTHIPKETVYDALKTIVKGKQNQSTIGLLASDIVKLKFENDEDKKQVADSRIMGNYGFKKEAVDHIIFQQDNLSKLNLKQVPLQLNDFRYYFSFETEELFRIKGNKVIKIKRNEYNAFWLSHYKKAIILKVEDIKDMVNNPSIKFADLISRSEILKKYNINASSWGKNNLKKNLPKYHTRVNNTGTKKKGWTKEEINKAILFNAAAKLIENRQNES